jgi:small subunit ribosomal protein S21
MSKYNNENYAGKKGSTVYVDGDFTRALRKFKKKVEESGVLKEVMERQHYTKPCEQRKKDKAAAKARWAKKLKSQELPKKMY